MEDERQGDAALLGLCAPGWSEQSDRRDPERELAVVWALHTSATSATIFFLWKLKEALTFVQEQAFCKRIWSRARAASFPTLWPFLHWREVSTASRCLLFRLGRVLSGPTQSLPPLAFLQSLGTALGDPSC